MAKKEEARDFVPSLFLSPYFLPCFSFFCLNFCRIAKVIAKQMGKNGVNGPAQNNAYADAMIEPVFHPQIAWRRYPPQEGEYMAHSTARNMANVFASLHSRRILARHFRSLFSIFAISFLKKPLLSSVSPAAASCYFASSFASPASVEGSAFPVSEISAFPVPASPESLVSPASGFSVS